MSHTPAPCELGIEYKGFQQNNKLSFHVTYFYRGSLEPHFKLLRYRGSLKTIHVTTLEKGSQVNSEERWKNPLCFTGKKGTFPDRSVKDDSEIREPAAETK